jgi:hypothetical protein
MDYKSKYLKYKTKYLNLSKIQSGGEIRILPFEEVPIRNSNVLLNTDTTQKMLILIYLSHGKPIPTQLNPKRLRLFINEHQNVLTYIDRTTIDDDINRKIKQYYSLILSKPEDYYLFDLGINEFYFLDNLVFRNNERSLLFNTEHFTISDEHKESIIYDIFNGYNNIYNIELPIKIRTTNIIVEYNKSTQTLNTKIIPFDVNIVDNNGVETYNLYTAFCAPEELMSVTPINEKVCVFYIGIIFHYILSNGTSLLNPNSDMNYVIMVSEYELIQYNDFNVSPKLEQYKTLTMQMLHINPDNRPTLQEISDTLHRFKAIHSIKPVAIRRISENFDDE